MIDHGRHSRAATLEDIAKSHDVRHRACGGRLLFVSCWVCDGCDQRWATQRINGWSDTEIGSRFYVHEAEVGAVALVWCTEGRKRFLRALPIEEAVGMERFR